MRDKPHVFGYKGAWCVKPRPAAYGFLFDTWKEAIEFALRPDFLAEYGRRIMT